MSRTSKHERIIREELEAARSELEQAQHILRNRVSEAEAIKARITTLERVLERADADKTGGDDA